MLVLAVREVVVSVKTGSELWMNFKVWGTSTRPNPRSCRIESHEIQQTEDVAFFQVLIDVDSQAQVPTVGWQHYWPRGAGTPKLATRCSREPAFA